MTNILKYKNFVSEKLNIKPIQKSELEQGNIHKRIPTFYVYKGWLCAPNIFFEGEYAVSEQPIPNAPDVSLYGVYRTYDEFKKGIFYINMSFHIIIFSANLFTYAMEFHSANTPRGFFKKNNVFVIKDDKLLVIYRFADFNKLKKENESKHISEKLNIKPVLIDSYKKSNEEKAAKFIEKFCLVYNETAKQYDCNSNMRLNNADLLRGKIPVRLGIVDGDFICNGCDSLVSLENAPIAVNGNFDCSGCDRLKSLKGAPLHVGGHFECRYCNMETLEYSPKTLGRDFDCSHCGNLKSLHGVTQTIRGTFRCSYCDNITDLKDSPSKIEGTLDCSVCVNLQSLEGMADEVTSIDCSYCTSLKSLVGSPKNLYGNFDCRGCDSLKNLIGAPQIIGGNFRCGDSENLESLEGAPKRVETFSCAASVNLKTLEHSPLSVAKYYCTDCDSLKNLIGITQDVKETIICYQCKNLESLEGAPQDFNGYFSCGGCDNLKSLEYLPKGTRRKVLPDHLKSSKTQKTVTANEKLNIQPMTKTSLSNAVSKFDTAEYRQAIVNLASDKINNFLKTIKTTEDIELFHRGNIDLLYCDASEFSPSDEDYYSDKGTYPTDKTSLVSYYNYDNNKLNWTIHTILFIHITPNGKTLGDYLTDMFNEFVDDLYYDITSIKNNATFGEIFSESELFDCDEFSCFLRLPTMLSNVNNIHVIGSERFKAYLNDIKTAVQQVENIVTKLKTSSHYIDFFRK